MEQYTQSTPQPHSNRCPNCNREFTSLRSNQKFCTPQCQKTQKRKNRKFKKTTNWYISRLWGGMVKRTKKYKSYREHGVEIRMTREEFATWARHQLPIFFASSLGKSPSVDRIDSKGHYELSNIQLISPEENSMKAFFLLAYQRGGLIAVANALAEFCSSERICLASLIDLLVLK